jgi:putative PIN family toxin of toxin-antitoxin system
VKVVFDTNTVVSALLFEQGRLSWLRSHWRRDDVTALVSRGTVDELIRVLTYPKFNLNKVEIEALLADYLPFTEPVKVTPGSETPRCEDPDDQIFIDLCLSGQADVLVTGDRALLKLDFGIAIETAAAYRNRWNQGCDP